MGRPCGCAGRECWNVLAENIRSVPGETEAGGSHIAHGRAGTASPLLHALCHPPLLARWLRAPLCCACPPVVVSVQEGLGAVAAIPGTSSAFPWDIPVHTSISSPSPASLGCPLSTPEPGPCHPSPGLPGRSAVPSRVPWNGRDVGLIQPGCGAHPAGMWDSSSRDVELIQPGCGPPPPAQDAVPSNQLHHAVHLKAAALASGEAAEKPPGGRAAQPGPEGLPGDGQLSPRNKSPASTASFIFAKSSRKLVIETTSSPEAQADLKRNLVAELMNFSGQRSAQAQRKPGKIPPPVAKKPSLGSGPAPSPKAAGAEALGSPVLDGDAKVEESRTKSELAGTEGSNTTEPPAHSLPAQDFLSPSHPSFCPENSCWSAAPS
uniref:Uncharacterized protein n=1 Tax=Cyanistes caeruleus TaxID=156563 RepID=A0A8C0V8W9_CYACU